MSQTNIINPKPCNYGCNTRIYWDNSQSCYLEVFTKQKHVCKNRPNNNNNNNTTNYSNKSNNTSSAKPNYYNNKYSKTKQPMDNTLEVLQGSSFEVKRKYEILTNLIKQFNGSVLGSQSHILSSKDLIIVVYFQVPEGKLVDFKKGLMN
jgi:hypothetical protein